MGAPTLIKPEVVAWYAAGWTLEQIGEECGVTRHAVYLCLKRMGVPRRRGGRVRVDTCACGEPAEPIGALCRRCKLDAARANRWRRILAKRRALVNGKV